MSDRGEDTAAATDRRDRDLHAIRAFLARQHVVGLAVAARGEIWAASCFYVFDPTAMTLYFLTDPATRHGALMAISPLVAGTVAGQPRVVGRIQGVQFSARVRRPDAAEEETGRRLYLGRFPVAALAPPTPLWALDLVDVKMTDNVVGFGTKRLWRRVEEEDGIGSAEGFPTLR